ncbi:MAG: 7-carboxy-7-deazaguanine synthase QueE [Gammaproteobacteria bacterium]|jgi:7-carboxy-7-deazaguanine synthase|nr:7-carboxy-7-deazaguanine synthase QueE [Gammaproteobacteria bacterium]
MTTNENLRITEVFYSLQGESKTVGKPTVFVRLTGCPLRCQYCDTAYAFEGGEIVSLENLIADVQSYKCRYVTVTGGEPLAQPNCLLVLKMLCDAELNVSLETSGALSIESVDNRVSVVMDLKTPSSLESDRNDYGNISYLKEKDQVKFVICDRGDYDWAKAKLDQYDLQAKVGEILFSPSFEQLAAADLAQWLLDDELAVRMQLQLHKILWGSEPGR